MTRHVACLASTTHKLRIQHDVDSPSNVQTHKLTPRLTCPACLPATQVLAGGKGFDRTCLMLAHNNSLQVGLTPCFLVPQEDKQKQQVLDQPPMHLLQKTQVKGGTGQQRALHTTHVLHSGSCRLGCRIHTGTLSHTGNTGSWPCCSIVWKPHPARPATTLNCAPLCNNATCNPHTHIHATWCHITTSELCAGVTAPL